MDISGHVTELKMLMEEEKRARTHLNQVRTRRKKIEASITAFLKETNDPGIIAQGLTISIEDKEYKNRKSKRDKIERATNVLRTHGVRDAPNVMDSLLVAMSGESDIRTKLHIKSK